MLGTTTNELDTALENAISDLKEKLEKPDIVIETIRHNRDYFKPYEKACMLLALININDPTPIDIDKAEKVLNQFHQIHFSSKLTIAI